MPRKHFGLEGSRQPISKAMNVFVHCQIHQLLRKEPPRSEYRYCQAFRFVYCGYWAWGRPRECAYSMEPKSKPWSPKSPISFSVYTARSHAHRPQVHRCVLPFPSAFSVAMVMGSVGAPSTRCSLLIPGEISPMVVPQL